MTELKSGEFFGVHYQKLGLDDFVITDTEYTHALVDWHFHQNPYFTYLLEGKLIEVNKKKKYLLTPGCLLFHNWQDAHYNIKPPGYARGFHIELKGKWFAKYGLLPAQIGEGNINLKDPIIKSLLNKILFEFKTHDHLSHASIDMLLLDVFSNLKSQSPLPTCKPGWVTTLHELLIESCNEPCFDYSLVKLGQELNIHPVHLSREFHRYFGTTLGQYLRNLKLNKAIILLVSNKFSMTEICYKCGFYDQSHFISSFKSIYSATPSFFLKQLAKC